MLSPRVSLIAFTGGDVGGKSTIMPLAKARLESFGMRVAILAEVASEFISAGFSPVQGWRNSGAFQEYLLQYMMRREEMYCRMLEEQDTQAPLVLLCDRGCLDSIAYMGRNDFTTLAERNASRTHWLRERYKAVIHLVTAADGAEDAYMASRHNNPGRIIRPPEEARELDRQTLEAWMGHPHHIVIDNSTDFEGKIERALSSLTRVLPMPAPEEVERKFLVVRGTPPRNAVATEIVQDYLVSSAELERRVRMRTGESDAQTFYYTEKSPTSSADTRVEKEHRITSSKYARLLSERDPQTQTVRKERRTFVYKSRTFEHDLYRSIIPGEEVIEVERCRMGEAIEFPPGYVVVEVTGRKAFSNRAIAEGRYPLEEAQQMREAA
jgi:CYTH domain-containing protein/thymidylate kinase